MSRISEALQRAQSGYVPDAQRASSTDSEIFVPAWTFPIGAEPTPGEPRSKEGERLEALSTTVMDELMARWKERLALPGSQDRMLVEQFRRLAATLHQAQASSQLKTVMVTSAAPGDGKTLTAINLALVLSESYRRQVLLIDADLRRPSIRNTRLPHECGLSEGLKAHKERKLTVIRATETLTLLPAGRPDPDPMSSLTSPRMRRILKDASERFDWVLLDAPPVGTLADASLLGSMVDAALFVVRASQTPSPTIHKAIEALGRERIIGIVLNGVDRADQRTYRAYEYLADHRSEGR